MLYTKEKLEQLQQRWTTKKGKSVLKTIKNNRCFLSPVLFKENVKHFPGTNDEEVNEEVDLRGAPLAGFDFRVPVQEDDEGYIEEIAILSNIHFEGANLKHCSFEGGKIHDCFFEDANLSHAEFSGASLNSCNFQETDLTGLNFHGTKLINCNFLDADIKDLTSSNVIVDQKTSFGKELKSEKEGNHHFASIEYKQIKEMYKNSSLHSIADTYHYKEMSTKRKLENPLSPMRWLNFIFGDLLCKYGTSFTRVLIGSILVMIICAVLFTINGSLLFYNTPLEVHSFWTSFYFSIVTFTTLGYGDYHAIGAMQFVAAIESFVGAALMSLFTVIVARNLIRD